LIVLDYYDIKANCKVSYGYVEKWMLGNQFNGVAHAIVKFIRGLDTNYTVYKFRHVFLSLE
jgi:hypothetical protein